MIREEEVYKIGRLGKPHGVKGEVQMQFADDVFDRVEADYLVLRLDGILVPFFLEEYRFKSDETALVKFSDVDTQERAAELTGADVFFPRALAEEDTDNTSLAELIGYQVVQLEERGERELGVIASIDDSTANVLIELEDGTLIPIHPDWVEGIDKKEKRLYMNIPDGLI